MYSKVFGSREATVELTRMYLQRALDIYKEQRASDDLESISIGLIRLPLRNCLAALPSLFIK